MVAGMRIFVYVANAVKNVTPGLTTQRMKMTISLHCSACGKAVPFYFKDDDKMVSAKLIHFIHDLKGLCKECLEKKGVDESSNTKG